MHLGNSKGRPESAARLGGGEGRGGGWVVLSYGRGPLWVHTHTEQGVVAKQVQVQGLLRKT